MSETATAERRRLERHRQNEGLEVRLRVTEAGAPPRALITFLVDQSEEGLGLLAHEALPKGSLVQLEPSREFAAKAGPLPEQARVAWCRAIAPGRYRLGLLLMAVKKAPPPPPPPLPEAPPEEVWSDYYELLQIHPKAHPDTIHRVYRLLAQRYHPDNQDTGDTELFRALVRAYETLSDPSRRAAYDLAHLELHRKRLRLLDPGRPAANGATAISERRKRHGLLTALYRRRVQDPANPSLSVFDLEDFLGVAREHLEFALWFVRERALVTRSDNNRFQITVAGVEECERLEAEAPPEARLLLPPG